MTVPSHETKTPRSPVSRFATGLPAFALFAPLILAGCSAGSTGSSGSGTSASQPIVAAHQGSAVLVTAPIDETKLVTLAGNTHPKANAKYDRGPARPRRTPIEHMQLVLKRSARAGGGAPGAHRSPARREVAPLPPVAHARRSSATRSASRRRTSRRSRVARVARLHRSTACRRAGCSSSSPGRRARCSEAFHTEIHALDVGGVSHIGNMSDPSIPAALAPVVVGIHALHDFMPHPLHRDLGAATRSRGDRRVDQARHRTSPSTTARAARTTPSLRPTSPPSTT